MEPIENRLRRQGYFSPHPLDAHALPRTIEFQRWERALVRGTVGDGIRITQHSLIWQGRHPKEYTARPTPSATEIRGVVLPSSQLWVVCIRL